MAAESTPNDGNAAAADAAWQPRHNTGKPHCPHCNSTAKVRSSRQLSRTYREQLMQCTNPLCGFTYVVGAEVLRAISPSATPDPDVHIPQSARPDAGVPRAANG